MRKESDHNNPKRIFKEKGGIGIPGKNPAIGRDNLTSIRHSEITSIAPDDINWNKIYAGKQKGPKRGKPESDPL